MSFPPATEMFQFAGFASHAYGFSMGYPLQGGLPHSEIPGSTIARISPGLFAACHVLHRLSVPRHPPDALRLRLSATPNGKQRPVKPAGFHRATGVSIETPEAECLGYGCQRRSLSAMPAAMARGPGPRRHCPSVTSQLAIHNVKTIDTPGQSPRETRLCRSLPPRAALSAFPDGNACRGAVAFASTLSAFAAQTPVGSRRLRSQASGVEVIGIEPTTSCLQSRRSPN